MSIEYDAEGQPTLATTAGNRVVLAYALVGRGVGKFDVCWENYPPSAADVEECGRWIEDIIMPGRAKVKHHTFDI